jgi:hypothetical protein
LKDTPFERPPRENLKTIVLWSRFDVLPGRKYLHIIAASVPANNGILITHNTGEFKRVPHLSIEDWTGALTGRREAGGKFLIPISSFLSDV